MSAACLVGRHSAASFVSARANYRLCVAMELDGLGLAITLDGGEREAVAPARTGCKRCAGSHHDKHTCSKGRSRPAWTAAPDRPKRRRSSGPTDVPALLHTALPEQLEPEQVAERTAVESEASTASEPAPHRVGSFAGTASTVTQQASLTFKCLLRRERIVRRGGVYRTVCRVNE